MEASSTDRALGIYEIVVKVTQFVDHPADLARCARLNSIWNAEAIPLLWKGSLISDEEDEPELWETPEMQVLQELSYDSDRFRYYLQHIQFLDLHTHSSGNRGLNATTPLWIPNKGLWKDARYCSITVDIQTEYMQQNFMIELLHPRLINIAFFGGRYYPKFFEELQNRVPRLQCLLIDDRSDYVESPVLRYFLERSQQLKYLELWEGFDYGLNGLVIKEILSMPSLEHLALGDATGFSPWAFSQVPESQRFPRVRSLRLNRAYPAIFPLILGALTSLEDLEVTLKYESNENVVKRFFNSVSRCSSLKDLSIGLSEANASDPLPGVTADTIVSLARCCPKLERLELPLIRDLHVGTEYESLYVGLGATLPHLEELTLQFCGDHSMRSSDLAALASGCPQLRLLELQNVQICLSSAFENDPAILFPNLQDFSVGSYTSCGTFNSEVDGVRSQADEVFRVQALEDLLDERMPRLQDLSQSGDYPQHYTYGKSLYGKLEQSLRGKSEPGPPRRLKVHHQVVYETLFQR